MCFASALCLLILLTAGSAMAAEAPRLELQPGDHISLIGGGLPERMQHDGWLETLIQQRFPKHQLSFRNLGFNGDEVKMRRRSARFGTPEEWLTRTKTNVVLAFFGYSESFAGQSGLAQFKEELTQFIQETKGAKYDGKSAPRLIVFSPIAHEDLKDRNLPDGRENNQRLALYTQAMAEVCKSQGVPFVDLFHATQAAYPKSGEHRTINGIHLNSRGNEAVARIIDQALFGEPTANSEPTALARLRQAVLDKNFHWFMRYRTVDGYSVFGLRADLKFVDGQTNLEVAQREMEVLDVMTANRDARVWAVAAGSDLQVDDSNTPPFIPVVTNKPGPLPGGKHVFLGGKESLAKMTVANGLAVNLFASEELFPELVNPVQMSWDTAGRLWVAVWPTYPHWKPKEPMNDKLLIFSDTDGDGQADRCDTYADHLHCPTGFEFYNGGVLIAQQPNLMYLKDTDGDGKADLRERVLGALDSADTHHAANSFVLDPGGAVYFQEGTFHQTQVERPQGPTERCANAGVYRYSPRLQKFEVYVTFGFANPHGHVFDRWGQDIVVDGTGSQPYHAALFSGRLEYPHKHAAPPQVYQQRTRPCPGMEILSSKHFPDEMQGNLLVGNVIGFQGILQYKLSDDGASFSAVEAEPLLSSTDPNFRPSDMKVGPDGAIYFLDWHNPIIGHMQHNLRDPSRDREHGRVYRVTAKDRPLSPPIKIAGEPIARLLDVLKEPEDRVRYRARIELAARDSDEVIRAAKDWLAKLDTADPNYEHHRLEGLWLHQSHNVIDPELLAAVLASKDFRARAAATRVLCYWRDGISDALERLKTLAADPHPRVRLEAVRAASFFPQAEAVEVALVSADQPTDRYLDFVRGETMKALSPYVKEAIAQGRRIEFTTPAGSRYFLRNVSTDDLLKLDRTTDVARELLFRPGVRDEHRLAGLKTLATAQQQDEGAALIEAIRALDTPDDIADDSVLFDLARLLTDRDSATLSRLRAEIEKLATTGKHALTRQLGLAALVASDADAGPTWQLASRSPAALLDLATAMPLIRNPNQRAALYPQVAALVDGLPGELADSAAKTPNIRYVRIELPGRERTLTLAEVEVLSGGKNIARSGKASQSSTAHGGEASRGIDGKKSSVYGAGGQTHTEENTPNPWWEVDLGSPSPVESIVVFNRADGDLGKRLEGFTAQGLNDQRQVVFQQTDLPAKPRIELAIGAGSLESAIRRAAMNAMTTVRGQEAAAFRSISRFVADDQERPAALASLLKIPTDEWPVAEAPALIDGVLAYLAKLPTADRTTPAALDAVQLGDRLSSLLPSEQGQEARRKLGELGVKVLRLGTVTDQMRYDQDQLVVQAGRPVEIIFDNGDIMPHNLVITEPGAMEEVGVLAESGATQPGAAARHYVPESNKILLASRLLAPRESQRLAFTAPTRPGVYAYVCTYPGHWRRMYGSLYVVENLEEYLVDPETYVAAHQLAPIDPLLKFNRPRKEWKFDELAESIEPLEGRSFASGKHLFQVATCIACHKLEGAGQELGPDLAKLDPKKTTADVLKSLLEPSEKIEDKYASYTFELDSGQVLTGMILEVTGDTVKVIENPLAKAEPRELAKSEIVQRSRASSSIMPKGLLDKLTHEEILDLLAYVRSGGNKEHTSFGAGHHGHSH
ncbi:MAG: c-type cytochrome [Pirellulales bacterium]|nr:c-type cytochrome [Pirellulales bacterium]